MKVTCKFVPATRSNVNRRIAAELVGVRGSLRIARALRPRLRLRVRNKTIKPPRTPGTRHGDAMHFLASLAPWRLDLLGVLRNHDDDFSHHFHKKPLTTSS